MYFLLRLAFYGRFADIHCPSTFIAAQLRHHGYRARLHVISNGVGSSFRPGPARARGADEPFRILMVGRFSPEKRQDVLIRAVRRSRHAARIQLHFAGHGPREKRLRRMASKLPNPAQFGYYSQEELIELIRSCDLYVHASDVEIEGVSCMEAFACGLVPIISDSRRSATGQFALGPRNLFRSGSPSSLAERIDGWIDDPAALDAASDTYARYAELYAVDRSVKAIERVYARAGDAPEAPAAYAGRVYRLLSNAFFYVIAIPLLFLLTRVIIGGRSRRQEPAPPSRRRTHGVQPRASPRRPTHRDRLFPAQTRLHLGTGEPPESLVRRSGESAGRRRGAAYRVGCRASSPRWRCSSPREGSCTSSPRAT